MKILREHINIIDDNNCIDVYEESAKSLWRDLDSSQRSLLENNADFNSVKHIIQQQQNNNITLSQSDVGSTFCALAFYFMPMLPVIEVTNSGNAILYRIEDGVYYFRTATSHFKFPNDTQTDDSCYYRIICVDSSIADNTLTMIRLSLPSNWKLKGA